MNHLSATQIPIKTIILFIILSITTSSAFAGADVYLIYSGKNRPKKNMLKKAMPSGLKIRTYNADLLAVADYSGKQKAAAKFDRAKLIIIIKDRPMEMLKGITVNKPLIIVDSVKTTVSSKGKIRYLLPAKTETGALEAQFKLKEVSSIEDLSEGSLFRVEENGPKLKTLLSHLVKDIVRP